MPKKILTISKFYQFQYKRPQKSQKIFWLFAILTDFRLDPQKIWRRKFWQFWHFQILIIFSLHQLTLWHFTILVFSDFHIFPFWHILFWQTEKGPKTSWYFLLSNSPIPIFTWTYSKSWRSGSKMKTHSHMYCNWSFKASTVSSHMHAYSSYCTK